MNNSQQQKHHNKVLNLFKVGIPEFPDSGRKCWTLDSGHWTLDAGLMTLDTGRWTLDSGH